MSLKTLLIKYIKFIMSKAIRFIAEYIHIKQIS